MQNLSHYLKYRFRLASPLTQTTLSERLALKQYAANRKIVVEIGVFHGVNTLSLRDGMSAEGTIIAVDPFSRSFFGIRGYGWARRIAHREVSKSRNGTILWVEDTGVNAPKRQEVARLLPIDFIFIDGDHSWEGLKGDWESWSANIKVNGIVCLHDSANRANCGSERYTNEVILKDNRFELIKVVDSLTILQRSI